MKMNRLNRRSLDVVLWMAAFVALCATAACGGGGGSSEVPAIPSGRIDVVYGTNGRVIPPSIVIDMAVAADGSVYLIGGATVRKLDASGIAVASYGEAGEVRRESNSASFVVIDEHGNLYFTLSSPGIAKVDSDGRPVPSFGVNGRASLGLEGAGIVPWRLARDASGNLYLLGFRINVRENLIAKVDSDGRLVTTYGSAGTGIAAPGLDPNFTPGVMRIDPRGFAYVAGLTFDPSTRVYRHTVAKLDASGALASDFGVAGVWTSDTCDARAGAALQIDVAGNVFFAGSCYTGSSVSAVIFKLDARGSLVRSFRDGGRRSGLFGGEAGGELQDEVHALLVQANGEMYAGGFRANATSQCYESMVAKLDVDGNPVQTFGGSGVVGFPSGPGHNMANALAVDAAGRLYVGVSSSIVCASPPGIRPSFHVYRLGS